MSDLRFPMRDATAMLRPGPAAGTAAYRNLAARVAAALVLAVAALPAVRAEPPRDADALRVATLAATCAACHGTEGRPIEGTALPGLAGRPAADLAAELRAFRDGQRPATVMHQIARGYDDRQIDALAAWFAARPPEARP